MKIFYFNDRKTKARVHIDSLVYLSNILGPAQGAAFEVKIPEGYVPFVKVWDDGNVLLSSVPQEMVMHVEPQKR